MSIHAQTSAVPWLARCAVALAVLLGLAPARSAAVVAAPPAAGCSGNLVANPGFEGASHKTESLGTSLSSAVGDTWVPWFVRGSEQFNREPEFKVEQVATGGDPMRVHSGANAQKWFTTWSTHTAGMYQSVRVPAGSEVTYTIYGLAYSGEDDGWSEADGTFLSDTNHPGNYRMAVGIDPGGAKPAAMGAPPPESVVWGSASGVVDQWVPLSVTAPARSSVVTVYTKGWPEWGVKHNDSFWDDACVQVTGRAARVSSGAGVITSGTGPGKRLPTTGRQAIPQ